MNDLALRIGTNLTLKANEVILAEDPGITPNDSYFPFMDELKNMAGGIISIVIVVAVIAFVGGAVILMVGKLSNSSDLSRKSTTILVVICALAALVGSASALIGFFTDIPLF